MFSVSSPATIVFLDRATLSPQTVLKPFPFPHVLRTFERTAAHEVAARIGDTDIVVTNKVRLDAAALADARRLRMIAIAATGTDIVDLDACAVHGIVVSNIRGYAVRTVPEHTFALIFALRRSLVAYRDAVRAGRWLDSGQFCFFDHPIRDLAGSTLGIVGDGVLGRAVAGIARARHAGTVRRARRCIGGRLRAARHAASGQRRDHAALSAHARDATPDRRGRVRADGTPAVADQYRARRARG